MPLQLGLVGKITPTESVFSWEETLSFSHCDDNKNLGLCICCPRVCPGCSRGCSASASQGCSSPGQQRCSGALDAAQRACGHSPPPPISSAHARDTMSLLLTWLHLGAFTPECAMWFILWRVFHLVAKEGNYKSEVFVTLGNTCLLKQHLP